MVCAQNGVASERFALRRFRQVYGMCVWLPATHLEPGTVEAEGAPLAGLLHIGRYPSGIDAIATQIGGIWPAAASAPVTAEVMRWKYGKLLSNLGNAIEAVCGFGTADAVGLRRRCRAEGDRGARRGLLPPTPARRSTRASAVTRCASFPSTARRGAAARPGRA